MELQASFGKTLKAQSTINSVTDVMRSNIGKIFSNQDDLEAMDTKSSTLKESTDTFANQAWRLEREARARRNRLYLIIASFVTAAILFMFLWN